MMAEAQDIRRTLPSVDKVLQALDALAGMEVFPHGERVEAVRAVLEGLRSKAPGRALPSLEGIVELARAELAGRRPSGMRRVVNGTGIVLHTGLGRAVLSREAMEAVAELGGCCNLQIDLNSGSRGRREQVIEDLLRFLTGAEAATVVNNNAGATLLVLAALAAGREVIVSRGQLIEIGGSFRLPDVIAQSGARMIEVGTTNKTHLRDYENSITGGTAVLMRVNPSNYRIIGFTQEVSTAELATLKNGRDLLVVDDLGCGNLVDLSVKGLPREPTLRESIAAGADIVISSCDKLMGGPQAGIIIGRRECVDRIRRHPLMRALRVGKFTIAALEATLKLFLNRDTVWERNPTLRMLAEPLDALRRRAVALSERLAGTARCEVKRAFSACGGGAMPHVELETAVVSIRHEAFSADELARRLRLGDPPVIPRIQDGEVSVDMRTLLEGDEERIEIALRNAVSSGGSPAGNNTWIDEGMKDA